MAQQNLEPPSRRDYSDLSGSTSFKQHEMKSLTPLRASDKWGSASLNTSTNALLLRPQKFNESSMLPFIEKMAKKGMKKEMKIRLSGTLDKRREVYDPYL